MNSTKILIIEDDPRLRRLMEFSFSNAGAETIYARDGRIDCVGFTASIPMSAQGEILGVFHLQLTPDTLKGETSSERAILEQERLTHLNAN